MNPRMEPQTTRVYGVLATALVQLLREWPHVLSETVVLCADSHRPNRSFLRSQTQSVTAKRSPSLVITSCGTSRDMKTTSAGRAAAR